MKTILKFKHWQLFLLIFGIHICIRILTPINVSHDKVSWTIMLEIFSMLISMGFYFLWLWGISITIISSHISNQLRKGFKVFWFLSASLIPVMLILHFRGINEVIINAVALLAFVAFVFCVFFAAKNLKSVESDRNVSISEYAGDGLLLMMFPIGIWFLQPRINSVCKEMSRSSPSL